MEDLKSSSRSSSSAMLFIGLPWLDPPLCQQVEDGGDAHHEDEKLLDELHDLARRLDERMCTIERIVQAENPNWRQLGCDPAETMLEDRGERMLADRNDRLERTTLRRRNV